ncbi:hypothetical protein C8J57DRAFT_1223010 [Mycena rebaudengoi]|nr:hypothetical protein C8J57DRAFT_1223010 [Mycena rebaudengoi]
MFPCCFKLRGSHKQYRRPHRTYLVRLEDPDVRYATDKHLEAPLADEHEIHNAKKFASANFRALQGRAVATQQFHATCSTFATSIKSAIQAGTFALQPERIWPNEFSWSGGFYLTPDKANAQLFGTTFLANACKDRGGVVVIEFNFDTSGLQVKEVGTNKSTVDAFRGLQSRLGGAFQRFLKKQAVSDSDGPAPPTDEGVSNDDNPVDSPPKIALPTATQLTQMTTTANALSPVKARNDELVKAFNEFKTLDVVTGAGSLTASQKVLIDDAANLEVGIPRLGDPFNQVVLVTQKAMEKLKFVSQTNLPQELANKQPLLLEFLKKKGDLDLESS